MRVQSTFLLVVLSFLLIKQTTQFITKLDRKKDQDDGKLKASFEFFKQSLLNQPQSNPLCLLCHETFNIILEQANQQTNLDYLEGIANFVCVYTKMYDENVCYNMIKFYGGLMLNQIAHHFLEPETACAYLKACDQPRLVVENITEWTKEILKDKPSGKTAPIASNNKVKYAILTDIHADIYYKDGSEADCGEPTCCRDSPAVVKKPAQKYGEDTCDTPLTSVEALISHLAQNHPDIDFVLLLGDYVSHCDWCQSYRSEVEKTLPQILDIFKKYFYKQGKPTIQIFSILGNHEAVPVDNIDFEDENNNAYVYHPNGDAMANWMNSPEAIQSFKAHGRYNVSIFNGKLRIIANNANMKDENNNFLLKNATDAGGNLKWLYQQLLEAEQQNQYAYVLIHEPKESGYGYWNQHFKVIIERFQHIIAAVYSGHTHDDQTQTFLELESRNPFLIQWIVPCGCSGEHNPSYRLVEADSDNYAVYDHTTYRLDVKASNQQDKPVIDQAYSFREEYEIDQISAQSIYDLSLQIYNDEEVAVKYVINYKTYSPSDLKNKTVTCDQACRQSYFCDIAGPNNPAKIDCGGESGLNFQDFLRNPWVYKIYDY